MILDRVIAYTIIHLENNSCYIYHNFKGDHDGDSPYLASNLLMTRNLMVFYNEKIDFYKMTFRNINQAGDKVVSAM